MEYVPHVSPRRGEHHANPGLPPGQSFLPFGPIGLTPTGANGGWAARPAVADLHANLYSFVPAHDTPPADSAPAGSVSFMCMVDGRVQVPMGTCTY
eukprot:366173-Chlamydomonas_euryale.AAC.2